jgi:hypothetical protein
MLNICGVQSLFILYIFISTEDEKALGVTHWHLSEAKHEVIIFGHKYRNERHPPSERGDPSEERGPHEAMPSSAIIRRGPRHYCHYYFSRFLVCVNCHHCQPQTTQERFL